MTNNNVNRKMFAMMVFFLFSISFLNTVVGIPINWAIWIMGAVAAVFWLYFSLFANDRD